MYIPFEGILLFEGIAAHVFLVTAYQSCFFAVYMGNKLLCLVMFILRITCNNRHSRFDPSWIYIGEILTSIHRDYSWLALQWGEVDIGDGLEWDRFEDTEGRGPSCGVVVPGSTVSGDLGRVSWGRVSQRKWSRDPLCRGMGAKYYFFCSWLLRFSLIFLSDVVSC